MIEGALLGFSTSIFYNICCLQYYHDKISITLSEISIETPPNSKLAPSKYVDRIVTSFFFFLLN